MSAAVYLAHEIEWAHARERAKLRFPTRKLTKEIIAAEFDPHAATELADLIEHRMRAKAAAPAEARSVEAPATVSVQVGQDVVVLSPPDYDEAIVLVGRSLSDLQRPRGES